MNSKLAKGVGAGFAAVALAFAAGGTHAAPDVPSDIGPNSVRGGVLLLDLGSDGGAATLSFDDVLPGQTSRRLIWVAGNDATSSVGAELELTFGEVRDTAAPCDTSLDKARGEIDSGVPGCRVAGGVATGTPQQGNLSRLLTFDVTYARASSRCSSLSAARSLLPMQGPGNLRSIVDQPLRFAARGADLVLRPGEGVCVAVTASWPQDGAPDGPGRPSRPVDNAAQGDSLSVRVRFDLTQVHE